MTVIWQSHHQPINATMSSMTNSEDQWFVQAFLGIVGYLMFGDRVRNEVTVNVFQTEGYARWISTCVIVAMAVLPLTKIPLK